MAAVGERARIAGHRDEALHAPAPQSMQAGVGGAGLADDGDNAPKRPSSGADKHPGSTSTTTAAPPKLDLRAALAERARKLSFDPTSIVLDHKAPPRERQIAVASAIAMAASMALPPRRRTSAPVALART